MSLGLLGLLMRCLDSSAHRCDAFPLQMSDSQKNMQLLRFLPSRECLS